MCMRPARGVWCFLVTPILLKDDGVSGIAQLYPSGSSRGALWDIHIEILQLKTASASQDLKLGKAPHRH